MSKMTFSSPAKRWKEALPIGDGKTAVMVYGKRGGERLDFNDATLWSGYPKDHDNAAAKDALPRTPRFGRAIPRITTTRRQRTLCRGRARRRLRGSTRR